MKIFIVRNVEGEVVYKGFNILEAESFGRTVEVWKNKKLVGFYVNKRFVAN